jgi:hypothetical protein
MVASYRKMKILQKKKRKFNNFYSQKLEYHNIWHMTVDFTLFFLNYNLYSQYLFMILLKNLHFSILKVQKKLRLLFKVSYNKNPG